MNLLVSDVEFTWADDQDYDDGLVGYVRLVLNGAMCVDGITVRRERGGRYSISYPRRQKGRSCSYPIVRPVDARTRREFESVLFAELVRHGFDRRASFPSECDPDEERTDSDSEGGE